MTLAEPSISSLPTQRTPSQSVMTTSKEERKESSSEELREGSSRQGIVVLEDWKE